jgi:tetratricopeptide (TPR) repeat protein
MRIRGASILALTLAFGISGCASGGGGGTGGGGRAPVVSATGGGGGTERPRNTADTRAAQRALDDAANADTPEAARPLYQQALQSAQAEIAADSLNPLGQRLAGEAYLGLEDYAQAATHFDKAEAGWELYEIELAQVREQAFIDLYQKAAPSLQSGDYEAAAAVLENADQIYKARPEAMITLAQIYSALHNTDKALEKLDETATFMGSGKLDEVDAETAQEWRDMASGLPLMRGQVLVDAGRFEDAVGVYRQLASSDSADVSIVLDLAAIYVQMGQQDSALAVYQSLQGRSDLAAIDYYRMGAGYYQASDYSQAAEAFGKDVQASPMDRDGLEMWARSLQLDSAFAQVPPVAQRWLDLDPASQIAITVLAQATNATGDTQRAGQIIRQADALQITVNDLEMRRDGGGGVTVNGTVTNKTLMQGATVNFTFTFYNEAGTSIGTAQQSVQVGAPGINRPLQVEFNSDQDVGGYGYKYTAG